MVSSTRETHRFLPEKVDALRSLRLRAFAASRLRAAQVPSPGLLEPDHRHAQLPGVLRHEPLHAGGLGLLRFRGEISEGLGSVGVRGFDSPNSWTIYIYI